MSTYLIGDVQGCWQSLKELLKNINYQAGQDRLGFVGDIINRGPQSLDVIRFIMDLDDPLFVLGNHEIYFLILAGGHIPRGRYNNTLDQLLDAPDCADMIQWLSKQPLIQQPDDEAGVLVHAGIPPQWSIDEALGYSDEFQSLIQGPDADAFLAVCFGNEPACWDPGLTGFDRVRYFVNAFTRMRYCTAAGQLDLDIKQASHPQPDIFQPWFSVRKPDPMPLYFGHWASLEGRCDRPNTFALDTGCVYGKKLTAIRLEDKKLFSVPASN